MVSSRLVMLLLYPSEILWALAREKYIHVRTTSGKSYQTEVPVFALNEAYRPYGFIMVNRNLTINLNHLERIWQVPTKDKQYRYFIQMRGVEKPLIGSRRQWVALKRAIRARSIS